MHELSIIQSVLEKAIAAAQAENGHEILRIKLRIGALSGVVPDALLFSFDALKTETCAAHAVLEIESVPAVCFCQNCQKTFEIDDVVFLCPACQGTNIRLESGRDLTFVGLEIS